MKKFKFSLDQVLRQKEWSEEQTRRRLAEKMALLRQQNERLADLKKEKERYANVSVEDSQRMLSEREDLLRWMHHLDAAAVLQTESARRLSGE